MGIEVREDSSSHVQFFPTLLTVQYSYFSHTFLKSSNGMIYEERCFLEAYVCILYAQFR